MKKMKRYLACLLALCLMLGVVPFYGFATEEENSLANRKNNTSAVAEQIVGAATALTTTKSTVTLGQKPKDGTVIGQPFDTAVSANYRIPGLVSFKGNLIAVADARWNNEKDGGGLDLVVSRSSNGNTWNYTFAGYLGDNGNVWNSSSSTLMDPVIATDGRTLYLFADMFPAGYSIIGPDSTDKGFSTKDTGFDANGNLLLSKDSRASYGYYLSGGKIYSTAGTEESGYTVDGWYNLYQNGTYVTNLFYADSPYQVQPTSYICMMTSVNGVNWTDPVLLNVKPQDATWLVVGPGSGLVTQDGYVAFTAYDNYNIYLIYGKNGVWNTVRTSAATNESSIVELNDGTIRAFVKRAGSNSIAYVDFTKNGSGYVAGNLVDTGVANFSQCMVSSLHYSKTLNGKEVVLVCCPSDSTGGTWNGRFNGKVYVFTVESNKTMTLVGTHQINNSFFAYSDMEELSDGTIGLLYEDGCINYQGNSYGGASHISYTTVNLETALGITFDSDEEPEPDPEPGDAAVYTIEDADAGVLVNFAPTDVTDWTMTVTPGQTVSGLNGVKDYVAFDITVTNQEGTVYTGEADVKLPLNDLADTAGAYPFVVESNGAVTRINTYIIKNGYITFRAPHFSVMGVAVDEVEITGEDTITESAGGGTGTEAGYYLDTDGVIDQEGIYVIVHNNQAIGYNGAIVNIAVTEADNRLIVAEDISNAHWTRKGNGWYSQQNSKYLYLANYITVDTAEKKIDLQQSAAGTYTFCYVGLWYTYYLRYNNGWVTTQNQGEATAVKLYKYVEGTADGTVVYQVDPQRQESRINAYTVDESLYADDAHMAAYRTALAAAQTELEAVRNGQYATEQEANNALTALTAKVDALEAAKAALVAKVTITVHYQHNGATIHTGTHVLAADAQSLTLLESVEVDGLIYRPNNATLTLTGDLTYVVPMHLPGEETIDILLYVGQTKTDIVEDVVYSDANVTVSPDSSIATLDSVNGVASSSVKELVAVTEIVSGKQYLLFNNRAGKTLTNQTNDVGLRLNGAASVDNANLWTIVEVGNGQYTVRYGTDGGYLGVDYGKAGINANAVTLQLDYIDGSGHWLINDQQGRYGLNDFRGEKTIAAGWTDAATDTGSWWTIYEIVDTATQSYTEVTFTGVAPGTTTAKIGATTYNITVRDFRDGDIKDFNNLICVDKYTVQDGLTLDLTGKVITKLNIDADTTSYFQLGIDLTDADFVEWSVGDESIATVTPDGKVSGKAKGETTVSATVYKNGIRETITIPVHVMPSMGTSETMGTVCYYIEEVDHTAPYYSFYFRDDNGNIVEDKLVQVQEGQVIYFKRPSTKAFAMIWVAAPDAGYALTYMAASGTLGEYYPLHDADGNLVLDDNKYYAGGTQAYKNVTEAFGFDKAVVNAMLTESLTKGVDGAMSMGRKDNDASLHVGTSLSFISDKIATVTKTVDGILPKSGLRADYRRYSDGMIATTDELLYFKISVTVERPHSWKKNADGSDTNQAALVYSKAQLIDKLEDCYFYTKELDQADGAYDGIINWEDIPQDQVPDDKRTIDFLEQINAPWGPNEQVRTVDFYVMYKIKEEDIPRYTIDNELQFDYGFSSSYTKTESVTAVATTVAAVTVVQTPIDDVVIDFCRPITLTDLDNRNLKFGFSDDDAQTLGENYAAPRANYGEVTVSKVPVDKDNNGVTDTDGDGVPLYIYTVTYTPTKILQNTDAVQISGRFYDENLETDVTKVVGGFAVYPAPVMHYEEFVITWDENWTGGTTRPIENQHMDFVGDVQLDDNGDPVLVNGNEVINKPYNYGYDPVYEGSNGASAGTQASTSTYGATGTFVFTGTGFEIYANCDETTGTVLVNARNNETGETLLYIVDTRVGAGKTDATAGQTGSFYSLPIVSARDLPHGSYTVTILKYVDLDENGEILAEGKPVNIDGVRIYGTVAIEDVFEKDKESSPSYVELRDLVLTGANVENKVTETEYSVANKIVSQVYTDTETLNAVVVINTNPAYVIDSNLQDLLDNGPKNELYLWPGQAVTFTLSDGITAQIGMKTVKGSSVDYTYNGANYTMNSSTNMFYHNNAQGAVTIANTGSGILSITMLKYWGGTQATMLAEVDEEQVVYALRMLRGAGASQPETTLHVSLVDYAGNTLASGELIRDCESDEAVFTSEEILAAVRIPDGYALANEDGLRNVCVAAGETGYVQILVGKVATLQVTYVTMYNQTTIQFGEDAVNLPGRTTTTVTLTKVQTDDGDAVFTMAELRAAAPAGTTMRGLRDVSVPYGQTQTITFFGSPATRIRVAAQWLLTQKAY